MADYAARMITITRYEWLVPIRAPFGAAMAEVNKASHAASVVFKNVKGRSVMYDDDLRFTADDENIIIFFEETEE